MRIARLQDKGFCLLLIAVAAMAFAIPGDAQQDMLPLHLEIGAVSLLRMPNWVALGEGIYKKNGLDVEQCEGPGTQEDLKAFGIQAVTQFLCPSGGPPQTNPPITIMGAFPSFMGQVLDPQATKRVTILSTSNVTAWPIIARKDITSPEQLKGKRIGILGFTEIHGFQAMVFAEAMGWDPRFDMTLIEREAGSAAFRDLQSGKVDAIVANEVAQWLAFQAGYKPLVDFKQWRVPMPSGSVNVDVAWLQKNRETARRFVKSLVEARAVMEEDRGAYNRTLAKYFNITDPKMQDFFYADLDTLPRKPYPAADGIRKAMKMYDGFFPQMRGHRIEEFVDDSFIRELDQSGYIDSLYKSK